MKNRLCPNWIAPCVFALFALSGLARFRLVEVEPTDPVTLVGITVVLAAVSLAACLLPVRRAARVDPVVALRAD